MLNPRLNRAPLGRRTRLAVMFTAAAIAISVAGGSAAQNFAFFAVSLIDQQNGALPGASVTLTSQTSGEVRTLRSDRTGRVEFDGLQPAVYDMKVTLPGFANATGRLELKDGQRVDGPRLTMEIGELEETVTVSDDGVPERRPAYEGVRAKTPECRVPTPVANASQPIGGNILAPLKVVSVPPEYPVSLVGSGRSANVHLKATIGVDGRVQDVGVVESPDAAFSNAALDAVRQWEFSQTMLNCQAVPVSMQVYVRFTGRTAQ